MLSLTPRVFFKVAFILILGTYGVWGAFDLRRLWLVDGANLLFHEAGHVFLGVFGEFIGMIGGTLMQLLIPAALMIAFWVQNRKYSASVMLFWLGENGFGISAYAKDARTQVLPFVGGEIHDWGYLLGKWHLLAYDQMIGNGIWLAGFCTVIAAVVSGIYFSKRSS